jgi:hypothetical protein
MFDMQHRSTYLFFVRKEDRKVKELPERLHTLKLL